MQIQEVQVNLYADTTQTQLVASKIFSQDLADTGTDVVFNKVVAQTVKVKILKVTGTYSGRPRVGLAEVEVIASGDTSTSQISRSGSSLLASTAPKTNDAVSGIYPNPVSSMAHLTMVPVETGKINYTIYDTKGRALFEGALEGKKGVTVNETISFSNYSAGMYKVKVESGHSTETYSIIKL
jgi:hypothetical protein